MEFDYLFRALLRRKWIILLGVALAVIVAVFLTRNLKKYYKSVAQLSTGFTQSEIPGTNQATNYMQSELNFNNAKENITSPKVLSLVSYHLLLHDLQSPTPFTALPPKAHVFSSAEKEAVIATLSAHLDSMTILSPNIPIEKLTLDRLAWLSYNIETIAGGLKVDRYLKSDYINVLFVSENPDIAAFVVNTLCEEFIRFYGSREQKRTNSSIALLDSLVKVKKAILEEKQHTKETYMATHGILDAGIEGTSKLNQISSLENLLITEQGIQKSQAYQITQLNDLIQKARASGSSSIVAPSGISSNTDNSEYLRLRKQYNDLYNDYIAKGGNDAEQKKQLDGLMRDMKQLNLGQSTVPDDRNGNQGVVRLEQLIQKKIDAEALLEESNQKVSSIELKLSQLRGGLSGMASTSTAVQQFDREIQIASGEYTSVKDQLNSALNFNETRPENIKQTLVGQPALKPEPSKGMLIIASAGLGALFLSCFIVCLIALLDSSVKTPSNFQNQTDLPLIGSVNQIKFDNQTVLEKIGSLDEAEKNRDNTFLELLRKLRYEIESSNKKSILFTSTKPQQGKTTLIQALSFIFSLGKKRVLIIDTNFCDNTLTKSNNAPAVLEKIDLNGTPFSKDILKGMITPTIIPGVDIIGCEGGDYTPTEILPRNHLLHYLQEIGRDDYDFIFLEGAPLNEFTDTKELLPFVDGLIVVFSSEINLTAVDKESISFLKENRDKFIGAILNKVDNNNLEL